MLGKRSPAQRYLIRRRLPTSQVQQASEVPLNFRRCQKATFWVQTRKVDTDASKQCSEDVSITGPIPLAPNDVKGFFTLFPKCFSSFVHTTCSLSDLALYLAFAEVHLRFSTALSNCTTLGFQLHLLERSLLTRQTRVRDDSPPWWRFPTRFIWLSGLCKLNPCTTIPRLPVPSTADSSIGLIPVHSPLLRESQLFSCPPLNDMLKFSGLSYIVEVAHKIVYEGMRQDIRAFNRKHNRLFDTDTQMCVCTIQRCAQWFW